MDAPFSLLVKPTCADCNLRCEYCFYLGKNALYAAGRHRMSDAVLKRMIQGYMATEQPVYSFGWQGGEPTLMGLEFFRKVTALQQRYGRPGATVANGLQTNATRLDDALARHFAEYKFLVGCSLDGPPDMHDRYRRTASGKGSHAKVMRGIETLQRHGVEFNILVLVSQANVGQAAAVYRYLTGQGFLYHQYIPCVEFDAAGRLMPYAIDGEAWGRFNIDLFNAWQADGDTHRVSIRHFDSMLLKMVDGAVSLCSMGRDCRQYFVVEHNGDIYPCDFFVEPELALGNVTESSWATVQDSARYRTFGLRKAAWHAQCDACAHLDLCAGDCLKHRVSRAGQSPALSRLCTGWKMFYAHARPGFEALAEGVRAQRREHAGRSGAGGSEAGGPLSPRPNSAAPAGPEPPGRA